MRKLRKVTSLLTGEREREREMSQHAQDHLLAAHSLVANKNPNPSLPLLLPLPVAPSLKHVLKNRPRNRNPLRSARLAMGRLLAAAAAAAAAAASAAAGAACVQEARLASAERPRDAEPYQPPSQPQPSLCRPTDLVAAAGPPSRRVTCHPLAAAGLPSCHVTYSSHAAALEPRLPGPAADP